MRGEREKKIAKEASREIGGVKEGWVCPPNKKQTKERKVIVLQTPKKFRKRRVNGERTNPHTKCLVD